MTTSEPSLVNTASEKPSSNDVPQTAAPRKRRRRAPATGATEDCFACRKRSIKCDRRRPYCTQCIDQGKDCSGYKTTLTWGVGVASRGKLRGLSLPIANPPPEARSVDTGSRKNSNSSTAAIKVEERAHPDNGQISGRGPLSPSIIQGSAPAAYNFNNGSNPITIPPAGPGRPEWPLFPFPDSPELIGNVYSKPIQHQHVFPQHLQRLHTTVPTPYEDPTMSASIGSLSTYSDSDYQSPLDFPQTPEELNFLEPFPPYPEHHSLQSASVSSAMSYSDIPRSCPMPDMSSSISTDQSNGFADSAFLAPSFVPGSLHDGLYQDGNMLLDSNSNLGDDDGAQDIIKQEDLAFPSETCSMASMMPPNMPLQVYSLTPRMQYLLDYYDKAICSVLVAMDGPTNPYRMHILPLAMQNEGLQNAIAALCVNNIRMRTGKDGVPATFNGTPLLIYSRNAAEDLRQQHGDPTPEELHYKAASIDFLNTQLSHPTLARDDSVLATLLILCLFHVCDSGFSKFRTQLAGVQKLISMRERERGSTSGFIGWIELFFTWFDVMTSTVNDRETQIRGDSLDMLDLSANLGSLEHLAGCEGRLFKLIARLGRLNLLSQKRPVRDHADRTPRPSPQRRLTPKSPKDYYSLDYARLDGNGWGTPITDPMDDPFDDAPDDRHEFWREWRDIRDRLLEWELPSSSKAAMSGASPGAELTPEQRDLLNISESFRHSALLYTERLGSPQLPSSHIKFQSLVAQALFHINEIGLTSCMNKFLLWPLFITGTECVDESQRGIVRQRCIEVQRESGFFNNLSSLEVLEKAWREHDDGGYGCGGLGQAFTWRGAMDRVDGEYIII